MSEKHDAEVIEALPLESVDALVPLAEAGTRAVSPLDSLPPYASAASDMFRPTNFPVLMMTRDLKIVSVNDACKTLVSGFPPRPMGTFFNLFGQFFSMEDLHSIRDAVMNGKNCHSWKGKAIIKSRERTTVEARVYIFPTAFASNKPSEFGVMFDDVTLEMKLLLRSVFMSLLEASKLKDNDTGKHIVRVNYYAEALSKALLNRPGYDIVDADFIDNIAFLASMHDVGKIGTPDDILNKEGPLSDFEWSVMKEHTINGAFILSTYPNPMAKEIALSHHEKWDGAGYPYQFSGDLIPLSARIVSIADVYDALRMKRAYKPPFTHDVALEKLKAASGTQFDPDLLEVMLTIEKEFDALYSENADD